jgi:hypothetical protein
VLVLVLILGLRIAAAGLGRLVLLYLGLGAGGSPPVRRARGLHFSSGHRERERERAAQTLRAASVVTASLENAFFCGSVYLQELVQGITTLLGVCLCGSDRAGENVRGEAVEDTTGADSGMRILLFTFCSTATSTVGAGGDPGVN